MDLAVIEVRTRRGERARVAIAVMETVVFDEYRRPARTAARRRVSGRRIETAIERRDRVGEISFVGPGDGVPGDDHVPNGRVVGVFQDDRPA
jgi:hypothetical protein